MAIFYFVGEGEVEAFDVRRKDCGARAEADVEELGCWVNSYQWSRVVGLKDILAVNA